MKKTTTTLKAMAWLTMLMMCAGVAAQNDNKLLRRSDSGERIRILDAVYGQDERICRAQDAVSRSCDRRDYCEVTADDRLCGNPYANVSKELFVGYDCGDGRRSITVGEGEIARIYCRSNRSEPAAEPVVDNRRRPPQDWRRGSVYVAFADYGSRDRTCDAQPTLAYSCDEQARCSVPVNNDLCGDPARGTPKALVVGYWCDGDLSEVRAGEGESVDLTCR
ncbi:MAG: hypothetical protein AB8B96_08410 [Lysobacterales bacterium]